MEFCGDHTDISGRWDREPDEEQQLSQAHLVWMVQEARCAGLRLKLEEIKKQECIEYSCLQGSSVAEISPSRNDAVQALHLGGTKGTVYDRLQFGNGLPVTSMFWPIVALGGISTSCFLRRWALQSSEDWTAVR